MDRDHLIDLLPSAHARAMRLHEAGASDRDVAVAIGVPIEGIAALLRIAAAKLSRLEHELASPDDAGRPCG